MIGIKFTFSGGKNDTNEMYEKGTIAKYYVGDRVHRFENQSVVSVVEFI